MASDILSGASRRERFFRAIFPFVVVGLVTFIILTLCTYISTDSGVFLYGGWRVLSGEVPYRDFFDHKGPLIYYINALALMIGHDTRGILLLQVIALVIAAWLAFDLMQHLFGTLAARCGTLLFLCALPRILQGGNLVEEWALPFQFGAFWLFRSVIFGSSGRTRFGAALGCGICWGLAFVLRPNLAGGSVAMALTLFFMGFQREHRHLWLSLGALVGAMVGIIGVAMALFARMNAFDALIENAWQYNILYIHPENPWPNRWLAFISGIKMLSFNGLFAVGSVGWLLAVFHLFGTQKIGPLAALTLRTRPFLLFLVTAWPIEQILTSLSGQLYWHYYMAWLPTLSFLGALAIGAWCELMKTGNPLRRLPGWVPNSILVTLGVWCLLPLGGVLLVALKKIPLPFNSQADADLVAFARTNSKSSDTVLLWGGGGTRLNFQMKRRSPSRYSYQLPLYLPGYASKETFRSFGREVATHHPRLIVDMSDPFIPPLEKTPVWPFLKSNYRLTRKLSNYLIYEPRIP